MDYLKKLNKYKESLTFPSDQRVIEQWEKSIRGNIVRSEVSKMDGVKELIQKLKEKIEKCNFILQNDRDLTEQERDKLFIRKDEQQWLINFFVDSEEVVKSAEDKIKNL